MTNIRYDLHIDEGKFSEPISPDPHKVASLAPEPCSTAAASEGNNLKLESANG